MTTKQSFDSIFRVHPLSEFHQLPWAALDPDRCSYDWSFGLGGHGLSDRSATITMQAADGNYDTWELPAAIAAMIRVAREAEGESVRHEIRRVLGIQ